MYGYAVTAMYGRYIVGLYCWVGDWPTGGFREGLAVGDAVSKDEDVYEMDVPPATTGRGMRSRLSVVCCPGTWSNVFRVEESQSPHCLASQGAWGEAGLESR